MKIGFIFRDPKLGGTSIELIYSTISTYFGEQVGVECENIYLDANKSFWANLKKIKSARCCIYHQIGGAALYLPLLRKELIVNSVTDLGAYKELRGVKKWLYGVLWVRLHCWAASRTTAISNYTAADLSKYFDITVDQVVHCPVHPQLEPHEKPFNAQEPVLLVVGTAPHKNLERTIRSIEGIKCKLMIIGRLVPSQIQLLQRKGIKYENFYELLFSEIIECYRKSDIVLFASTHEGFGMPIIESNAIGRPVITSNICSMPEVADDSAILVDPYDERQIREAVLALIKSKELRQKHVQLGLKNAERFVVSKIAGQYMELYEEVLSDHE